MSLDLQEFIELLNAGRKMEFEDKIWQRWLTIHPMMVEGRLKWISFIEYRDSITGGNVDKRSNEEIIAELEELHGKKLL